MKSPASAIARCCARKRPPRKGQFATPAGSSRSWIAHGNASLASSVALPSGGGRLEPVDKKQLGRELTIPPGATADAKDGDLVAVELTRHGRLGLQTAQVKERLGSLKSERAASFIAIHAHEIPHVFRRQALARGRGGEACAA